MAQVAVDEAELLQYQRLAGAAQAILANPESRKLLHRAQKIVNPQARIPEVEIEERVEGSVSELRGEMQKISQQLADERAERDRTKQAAEITDGWDRQKRELRARGFTDDGLAKIEAHALQEGIPNLRAAANDYLALNPPAAPETPSGFGAWDFFGPAQEPDTFVEKMIESRGENEGVLNKEIQAALTDFRAQTPMRGR